ncbi:MAG: NAD-dependent epimerase/dehydratase family protein [Thermoleophilaceae bacterium]
MRSGPVLVTGAEGFVGTHLIACAEASGVPAVAARGDLRRPESAREVIADAGPVAVVHLASAGPAGPDGSCAALADDARMAANLLAALAEERPDAPVLIAGSAAQYGLAALDRLPESAPLAPVAAYGAAKTALELACAGRDAPCVIWARTFNLLGPGQPPSAPVSAWARRLVEAERGHDDALRTGRLDVVRDFLDVRDAADAYLALLASAAEGPVNVCSGRAVTLSEILDAMIALSPANPRVERDPALERALDPPRVVGDPGRLHALTGWEPRRSLGESLTDVLEEWRARAAVDEPRAEGVAAP